MSKGWRYAIGIGIAVVILIAVWFFVSREDPADMTPQNNNAGTAQGSTEGAKQSAGLDAYLREQEDSMAEMMEDMSAVQKSGNVSVDFLKGMIPHHEAAIEMAEDYLENGGNHAVLQPLAQNIITAQTDEIKLMREMIDELEKTPAPNAEAEAGYWEEYNTMMTTSHAGHGDHGTAAPESLDAAFADGMIMHHQMAIDMANSIIKYTDLESVRTFAQNIVTLQEQEIADMQAALETPAA